MQLTKKFIDLINKELYPTRPTAKCFEAIQWVE